MLLLPLISLLLSACLSQTGLPSVMGMANGIAPAINQCSSFACHGHAGVAASSDQTVIYGNVGGDNSISGFGAAPQPHVATGYGYYISSDSLTLACDSDKSIAYNQMTAQACTGPGLLAGPDLSGLTLGPGVYCNTAGYFLITTGSLTLSGYGAGNTTGVWVFQTASYVTTSTTTQVVLSNGALASNVFWAVGSSMTLADTSSFIGTVIAYATISIGTKVQFEGRALALTASVTLAGNDALAIPSLNFATLNFANFTGAASASAQLSFTHMLLSVTAVCGVVLFSMIM